MSWALVCKVFQRKFFDLLTHKSGFFAILFLLLLFTMGLLYFGEVLMWYFYKSGYSLAQFIDNIGGRSFHGRLCHKLPIDVVYTWVNGSDPRLIRQLLELKKHTTEMQNATDSSNSVCTLSDCIPANGIIVEHDMTNEELLDIFISASIHPKIIEISKSEIQVSCLLFESKKHFTEVISLNISTKNNKIKSVKQLFYTSDSSNINSHLRKDLILVLGLPEIADGSPKSILSKFDNFISDFIVDMPSGIASFYVQDKKKHKEILNENNFTVSGKVIRFLQGHFVWNLDTSSGKDGEATKNRFRDMDELKFSLRSLEKFAPWVRQVFIVTNGQIPAWLDLSNPRVSVIVHEDIFTNLSHLPTFSSPAIESHLHRIPGLSENFIYLNDDIFFGTDVWPDDFVAEDGTQSIYLTYSVPDCKVGCPGSWIRDGYCDRACNCSECEWDGGDCNPNVTSNQNQYAHTQNHGRFPWSDNVHSQYCHPGCADNWIADRYCDASCNTYECGFDAGDCGVENFAKIQLVSLRRNQSEYSCIGFSVLSFDLSDLFEVHGNLEGGEFQEEPIVRRFSYVNSSKLLTLVLKSNNSRSAIMVSLNFKDNNSSNFTFNFTISVDTSIHEKNVSNLKVVPKVNVTSKSPHLVIINPDPIPKKGKPSRDSFNLTFDLEKYVLPASIQVKHAEFLAKFNEGMLTEKGLEVAEENMLWEYFLANSLKWTQSSLESFFQKLPISANIGASTVQEKRQSSKYKSMIYKTFYSVSGVKKNMNVSKNYIDEGEIKKSKQLERSVHIKKNANTLIKHSMQRDVLPWEKRRTFRRVRTEDEKKNLRDDRVWRGRHLMDAFADSIRHVNRIYNRAYGHFARKVPAHSAHFFDRRTLSEMSSKFHDEFQLTSSHKIRSETDMQLAFSYYYFLMSEKESWSLDEIFRQFDLDESGVLSDRELRLLTARTHRLPLFLKEIVDLESKILNCSHVSEDEGVKNPEVYHESRLPQVTLNFIKNCSSIKEFLQKSFSVRDKYKYKIITYGDGIVSFKMIRNNATAVVRQLDDIRKNVKKFVCLNDDVEDDEADPTGAEDVRSIVKDFYLTFFPRPSQFELKGGRLNEFTNMAEYREIRRMRAINASCAFVFIVALTFVAVNFTYKSRCRIFAVCRVF